MPVPIVLGPAGLLAPGTSRCFLVRGRRIAVFRAAGGALTACDDLCPHAGAPLSDGWIEDGCVVCPWHGARFDIATGEALSPPAAGPVEVFRVADEAGDLVLEWPGDEPAGA
jgi:nitrite reductase/ring-hydroxylating ferredoxin subunit